MLLERIYDEDLAQASYIIGCQATGEALVIDPRRDLGDVLARAESHGVRIVAVTETHIHADYLSGTRELAAATGARIYVSDEGGPDWTYGPEFDGAVRMKDGHDFVIGNLTVQAMHTPGHTPEHMSLLVTDGPQADAPGFLFSGDFVFVGDLGRPDLLDEAAGGVDTRFAGAQAMYASLRDRFLALPDYVQVHPAHGAGSACGKALGAIPSTTVGYERAFAWWAPFLAANDEQGFIDELLSGQPDAHAYFARMKTQNREGPDVMGETPELVEYTAEDLRAELDADRVILVDTRDHRLVHGGTVPGSLNIPGTGKTASFGAWAYNPEVETRPVVLLAGSAEDAERMRDHLMRVGIDAVQGWIGSLDGLNLFEPPRVAPADLRSFAHDMLLDVRNKTEFAAGHVPGAHQLSGGRVLWHLDELPHDGTIVSYCQSGVRNSVAASALRRAGYNVVELDGSYLGWTAVDGNVPVVPGQDFAAAE